MKILKTYHCNLKGNKEKLSLLKIQHYYCQVIARYYLRYIRRNKEYRKNEIHKATYSIIREKYPFLHSKLIQHIRDKVLSSVKDKKLFKVRKLNFPLIFDYQSFDIEFKKGYYDAFIKILKNKYPLSGLRTINIIKDKKVKEIQIKLYGTKWRIYFICETECQDKTTGNQTFGIDTNTKNITLSNNQRYSLKIFFHKKMEFRKHGQGDKISNYSRNFFHQLTTQMVKDIIQFGGSKIVLEDLTNLRKSASRKCGTSKGRNMNYVLNNTFTYSMFQSFLEYKCKESGIQVSYCNPRNTSRTCNVCKGLNTERPRQSLLICHDCDKKHNAELNAANNIQESSPLNGVPNESIHEKQLEKHVSENSNL